MAVTSSTRFLTTIKENGSDPTGSGGLIINENFERLDSQFSSTCSTWYAKSALWASSANYACNASYANYACNASYANYAYSLYSSSGSSSSGSGSNSDVVFMAKQTGFAQPTSNYSYSSNPIALWGSYGYNSIYSSMSQAMLSGCYNFADLPPYGPFLCKAFICAYPSNDKYKRFFAECLIGGWNVNIDFAKVIRSYDSSGSDAQATATIVSSKYTTGTNDSKALYFGVSSSQLFCGVSFDGTTGGYVHMTTLSLYPSSYELACS